MRSNLVNAACRFMSSSHPSLPSGPTFRQRSPIGLWRNCAAEFRFVSPFPNRPDSLTHALAEGKRGVTLEPQDRLETMLFTEVIDC